MSFIQENSTDLYCKQAIGTRVVCYGGGLVPLLVGATAFFHRNVRARNCCYRGSKKQLSRQLASKTPMNLLNGWMDGMAAAARAPKAVWRLSKVRLLDAADCVYY